MVKKEALERKKKVQTGKDSSNQARVVCERANFER